MLRGKRKEGGVSEFQMIDVRLSWGLPEICACMVFCGVACWVTAFVIGGSIKKDDDVT